MRTSFLSVAGLAPLLLVLPAAADIGTTDLADLSIEELANIQITSVSKKPERLADAAASVFVITADDIRRSGATSIADALRLAPNLQVGQYTSNAYAITARGLNGTDNSGPNKLLVMIDGRSVYSPMFSGVFWENQDTLIEDIERIEVISGPGGTLWGVNAVNGVINITTRSAKDSGGSLVALGAGERGHQLSFRHGASSADGAWRVYGKQRDFRHTELADGGFINDSKHDTQIGFRSDWRRGGNTFSVNGNAYQGRAEQPEPGNISVQGTTFTLGPVSTSGVNLTGSWNHALDGGGSLNMQAYFDRSKRSVIPSYAESLDIVDLQFQHSLAQHGAHSLVWGANFRHSWDDVSNSEIIAFLPGDLHQTWASLFAQDEMRLREDLRLTGGIRVERNDYTGTEVLPTLRLAWKAAPAHSLWGGLSRTVRAPSRLDVDTFQPGRPPYVLRGGPEIRSEVAKVVELGYRGRLLDKLSFSATAFFNQYDHLRTLELAPSGTSVTFGSLMEGRARGIEMWGNYQPSAHWRLSAGLFALHQSMWLKPGGNNLGLPTPAGRDPSHTAQLRSTHDLGGGKELEIGVRKVGALTGPDVPGYTAIDARLGWKLSRNLELSLVGQNLNGAHAEYANVATRSELGRAVAVKLVWEN